jgi:flagellar P-ring protein precursor FlgI
LNGSLCHGGGEVRIKDIATFEGVRDNQLIGYGLVVGLNGTGDSLRSSPFTAESLVSMLERLGVNTRAQINNIGSKNIAAVMVTATLPPFARRGSNLDITVAALGDAKNLMGGTLLVTSLMGADGDVYAVGQGQVQTGSIAASGNSGSTVTKGVPTSGKIPNGALVEKEINYVLNSENTINISLRNPDFTTARRMADVINKRLGSSTAKAIDPTTVVMTPPGMYKSNIFGLIADVELLTFTPDQTAKIIIDEQNGVIVMGENVKISTVAVAHGNLTIRVSETPQVSQPAPFSTGGTTKDVARTNIAIDEGADRKLAILDRNTSLHSLVKGLNMLGVSPRDMITILQSIKASGALQSDIEVR